MPLRLFGGWDFNNRRPEDHALISADLKKVLLDRSLLSADQDMVGRAQHAFGQK